MQNLKLLIVDDSPVQREYMLQLCHDIGFAEVSSAENGEIALPMLQQHKFDVLICDLEMPGLDGIELLHKVASLNCNAAVIIVSGREQNLLTAVELMARSDGLQVLGSLQKPLDTAAFSQLLSQLKPQAHSNKNLAQQQQQPLLDFKELSEALQQHRFVLHYQPKVDVQSGQLAGVEALVRLQHPSRGLIYPGHFIAVCERFNLIDALSYEVLLLAIAQLQQWRVQGFVPNISVNLSATSFENAFFLQQVNQLLADSAIDPAQLMFEVTETAVIRNMGQALAFLSRLRLSGFGLSIDDYGTGYSSVKQLSQIPFTELKIDRSLIDGIASRRHLQVILSSTLSMCQQLGIKVVAEGVESHADWQYLQQFSGLVAQGYYLAKPMPCQALEQWIQQGCRYAGASLALGSE